MTSPDHVETVRVLPTVYAHPDSIPADVNVARHS